MQKTLHSPSSCTENFSLIHIFHPFYLSITPVFGIDARECFDGPAAPQQGMVGALIVWWPASFRLQGTMAEGTVYTGSPDKFPTKPTEELKRKMYAIKQIKICSDYLDILPRPRLDFVRFTWASAYRSQPSFLTSFLTSLGLGSMPRYSAQILICIIKRFKYGCWTVSWFEWDIILW